MGSPLTIASYAFERPTVSSDLIVRISCLLTSSRALPPEGGLETDDSGRDIREVYASCGASPDDPVFEARFRAFLGK